MGAVRIAIATPSANAYSETFIAAHMRRLRGVEFILADGELPNRVVDGPLLLRRDLFGRLLDHLRARLRGMDTQGLLRVRIADLLRERRIDVLMAEYGTCAHALIPACRAAGTRLVAHFHGFDAHRVDVIERMDGYQELFAYASKLVVVSRAMEQQLLALGAPRGKVVYNCYGIDVEQFTAGTPAQAPPHFVAVGRFVEKKAPHLVIAAFQKALEQVPEAHLTMVGKGRLWDARAQQVRDAGLSDSIDLCGVRSTQEVAELMRGARGFVQHSVRALNGDSEGTPLAVLEAMASGLPVIATRHTGIADVVTDGREGLLCDEFDVDAMARNVVRVAMDPVLAGRLGQAARISVARDHRIEDSVLQLQAILASVVAE